jgi:hypothetical protein
LSSTATAQNWTPRKREVCGFFDTSSGHAKKYTKTCKSSVSTYYQPNLEPTQNQPRILCLKFWAQVATLSHLLKRKTKSRKIIEATLTHYTDSGKKHACKDIFGAQLD